ncbi:VOC family protein [Kiloniella laminariae]|uniref:VOC family protein n=1 Tax=Kiloniella laminariae TaxID=454162 RepID=UPI0003A2F41B|nr:VOC family protein [Kiloniella laminariae]
MQRAFANILSDNISGTAKFYEELLGMTRHFDSDWFIILSHPDIEGLEYGLLRRDHAIVPEPARAAPAGIIMTFVVMDCDAIYQQALRMQAEVVEKPTDMAYGQRRMLVRDPEGTILDISSPVASQP